MQLTETGKVIFDRTYSRKLPDGSNETWPQTVRRVVDGNLALVDERYQLPNERADLIRLMTEFKIVPAGRHLWASGVKGAQHLMNCWVSHWTDNPSDHFEFTFMRLMEGGGVGTNYSNSYLADYPAVQQTDLTVEIVCHPDHADFVEMHDQGLLSTMYDSDWDGAFLVEDSREGWAAALVDLIDTFYRTDTPHRHRVYDVSNVRPAGARLKTFGGTASGPEPFARMMHEVAEILNRVGDRSCGLDIRLTGIDAMEIDHSIAQCVVSGGVRRSARMAMMHWEDPQIDQFLSIKQDSGSHWTTNISVVVDDDFWHGLAQGWTHAGLVLDALARGMHSNGEPGFFDISYANQGEPDEVVTTNPCFHPDTLVETVNGPARIADITEPTMVYTKANGRLSVRKASAAFKTKSDAETLRIGLSNGDELIVTPDHRIMLRDGEYVRADQLKQHDRLETICRARRGWRYSGVKLASEPNRAYRMEHRMIYEGVHGEIADGFDIDHINRDHHDNRIDNLRKLSHSEHSRLSRSQVPNDHQVFDERGKFAKSGRSGAKPADLAIKPPRSTNWGRAPRVTYVVEGPVTDVYDITVDETHNLIANGVVAHNCGEITLNAWEPCNLGHVNLAAFAETVDGPDLALAHRLMTRFLIRATFAQVSDPKSRAVLDRNRRIGVGHLGVASYLAINATTYAEGPTTRWFTEGLRALAYEVDHAAIEFCNELRIPVPVKLRTVAPTGTIAKMPGVSEGIHPIFSKYFIRRIRFSTVDADQRDQLDDYRRRGFDVEPCQYAANTAVVSIPTKDSLVADVADTWGEAAADQIVQGADELTLDEMLRFQAMYQNVWADNAVSYTANFDPAEYTVEEIRSLLVKYGGKLKGATVFPEVSMPQSPYQRLTREQYELYQTVDIADGVDEECASGACPIR